MGGSVNRVILLGYLGSDPETRGANSGRKIVAFRMATSQKWRDKQSGEPREKTEWSSVVIFNEGIAKVAEKYLRKGSQVYLEGSLQTRKWQDQSGADRYTTEVVLNQYDSKLVLLGGKSRNSDSEEEKSDDPEFGSFGGRSSRTPRAEEDDEIPF